MEEMMSSVNRVILMGHLGQDPEARQLPSGKLVVNFSLATNRRIKEGDGLRSETDWHRIVAFDKVAELSRDYLKKGRPVYIEGRLCHREWEDREGKKRRTTEVIAENLQFLPDGRRDGDAPAARTNGNARAPVSAEIPF
jgi:single-strand DNA-binding protein